LKTLPRIKKRKPKKEEKKLEKEEQIKKTYKKLLNKSEEIVRKSKESINLLVSIDTNEIEYFIKCAEKLINQIERRVFNNEQIPHEEKMFSIFEPHTEWISKGKARAPVELGKRVAVVEDQYQFIHLSKVLDKQTDDAVQ